MSLSKSKSYIFEPGEKLVILSTPHCRVEIRIMNFFID